VDIRDEKQVRDSVQKAVGEFGGIDIGIDRFYTN
jgi:hypothetical protein